MRSSRRFPGITAAAERRLNWLRITAHQSADRSVCHVPDSAQLLARQRFVVEGPYAPGHDSTDKRPAGAAAQPPFKPLHPFVFCDSIRFSSMPEVTAAGVAHKSQHLPAVRAKREFCRESANDHHRLWLGAAAPGAHLRPRAARFPGDPGRIGAIRRQGGTEVASGSYIISACN